MKWCLLMLLALTLLANTTAGETRQRDMTLLARQRASLFKPRRIHKSHAKQEQASIFILHKRSQVFPVLKLRGGGAIEKFSKYIGDSRTRSWVVLLISILLDTMSSTLMKMGRDEGSVVKLLSAYAGFFTSLSGFALALGAIEVSIAYAVWAALGTAIVSFVGIVFFKENYDIFKLLGLLMIIVGVAIVESRS